MTDGDSGSRDSLSRVLCRVLQGSAKNCLFYTEKQLFTGGFAQFCNLTKLGIEIPRSFVYNVCIAVRCTESNRNKGE